MRLAMRTLAAVWLIGALFFPDRAGADMVQGRLTRDLTVGTANDVHLKSGQTVQVLKASDTTDVVMATGADGSSGVYQVDASAVMIVAVNLPRAPTNQAPSVPAITSKTPTNSPPSPSTAGTPALQVTTSKANDLKKQTGSFEGLTQFEGPCPKPAQANARVLYDFNLADEHFWLYAPSGYDGSVPWGLIVFDPPFPEMTSLPEGWADVLNDEKLILIAPQKADNKQDDNRRLGLCVVAALEILKQYAVDSKRVYIGGYSGGARVASELGFYQSDLFHATIQCCGSDFYKSVPRAAVTDDDLKQNPETYGLLECDPADVDHARKSVKFAITTGPGDFREHFLQDIYNGGYAADGFQAKLWDVPGTEHEPCPASTLREVLRFIEGDVSTP